MLCPRQMDIRDVAHSDSQEHGSVGSLTRYGNVSGSTRLVPYLGSRDSGKASLNHYYSLTSKTHSGVREKSRHHSSSRIK